MKTIILSVALLWTSVVYASEEIEFEAYDKSVDVKPPVVVVDPCKSYTEIFDYEIKRWKHPKTAGDYQRLETGINSLGKKGFKLSRILYKGKVGSVYLFERTNRVCSSK